MSLPENSTCNCRLPASRRESSNQNNKPCHITSNLSHCYNFTWTKPIHLPEHGFYRAPLSPKKKEEPSLRRQRLIWTTWNRRTTRKTHVQWRQQPSPEATSQLSIFPAGAPENLEHQNQKGLMGKWPSEKFKWSYLLKRSKNDNEIDTFNLEPRPWWWFPAAAQRGQERDWQIVSLVAGSSSSGLQIGYIGLIWTTTTIKTGCCNLDLLAFFFFSRVLN